MVIRVDFSHIPDELEAYPWRVMLQQGYHWMDKYGYAHWIPDMETSYLENALRFARHGCSAVARSWWWLAMRMNGEMAIDAAESYAMRYEEGDVPLIKGLENELARRAGESPPHSEWELSDGRDFLEDQGYNHMDALQAMGPLFPTPTPGIYKVGEPWNEKEDM